MLLRFPNGALYGFPKSMTFIMGGLVLPKLDTIDPDGHLTGLFKPLKALGQALKTARAEAEENEICRKTGDTRDKFT